MTSASDQRNEEALAAYNAENLRKLILKRDELRNLWMAEQAFRKLMGLPIEAPCSAGMSCLTGAYVRLRAEEGSAAYCIHEIISVRHDPKVNEPVVQCEDGREVPFSHCSNSKFDWDDQHSEIQAAAAQHRPRTCAEWAATLHKLQCASNFAVAHLEANKPGISRERVGELSMKARNWLFSLHQSPSPKLLAMVEPVGGFPQPQPPLNGTTQLQPSGMDPRKLKVEPEEQGPIGALHGTQLQQIQQLPPASFAYQAPVAKAAGGLGAPLLGPVSGAEVRGQGLEGEEAAVAVEGVHLGAREVEFVCQLVAGQPGVFRAQVHALTTPQAGCQAPPVLPQRLELGTRRHMSQAQWATSLEMHWDGTLYILEPPAAAIALGQGAEGSGTPAGASNSRKMHLRETAVFDQIVGFLRESRDHLRAVCRGGDGGQSGDQLVLHAHSRILAAVLEQDQGASVAARGGSSSQRTLAKHCMFLMRLCKDVRRFDGQSQSQGVPLQQQQAVLQHMLRKRKAGPSSREPALRTKDLAQRQAVPAERRQQGGEPEQTADRQQAQPAMGYRVPATGHKGQLGASTPADQAAAAHQGATGQDQPVQWQTIQVPTFNSSAAAAATPPPEASLGSAPLPLPEGWVHADQPAAVAPTAWQGHQPGPQLPPGHPAAFAAPLLGTATGRGAARGVAGPGLTPHPTLPWNRGPPSGSNQATSSACHWQPPGAPPSGRPPTQQPTSSTVGTFRQMPCEMAMAAIHGLELLDITPASEFNTHALAELGKLPPILQLGILGHYMNRPACWQNPSRSLVDSAEYAQRKHLINPPPWLRGKWLGSNCSLAPGARAKLDKLVSKGALEPLHRFPEGRAALDELQGLPYPLQDQTVPQLAGVLQPGWRGQGPRQAQVLSDLATNMKAMRDAFAAEGAQRG